MSRAPHELVVLFCAQGLPLNARLVEMLNEDCSHRTERRGCGYTQATRFLSTFINQPRDPMAAHDLGIFQSWPSRETEHVAQALVHAGWASGWRRLAAANPTLLAQRFPDALLDRLVLLPDQVRAVRAACVHAESRILTMLIEDIVTGAGNAAAQVPGMPEKPEVGSCSQAEEFFLEIAHRRLRRGGSVNTVVDTHGAPLMLEKMNLGESHSAIVVAPFTINGVAIPPGALCALRYRDPPVADQPSEFGRIVPLTGIAEARFLRLTTLAVAPADRRRAFSAQIESQLRSDMFSPLTTTIEQLHALARQQAMGKQ